MPRMPESAQRGQTSPPAGEEVILGVDTHKDTHVAVLVSTVGMVIGGQAFPTTAAGYRQLLAWPGASVSWAGPGWRALAATAPR